MGLKSLGKKAMLLLLLLHGIKEQLIAPER